MRFPLLSSLLLLALSAGCASTTTASRQEATAEAKPAGQAQPEAKEEAAPAPQPGMSLQAALAREFEKLPTREVAFPDQAFTAEVEASGEPQVTPHEGFFHVSLPVGTAVNMECFVYPKHLDSGAALLGFISSVTESVQLVQLRPVEIAPVGTEAVVVAHANYVTETPNGKQGGVLKIAVRAARGSSLLCYHDEPGYSKAFSRMVQTFAGSLEPKEPQSLPALYSELQVVRFREIPVGFERRRVLEAKSGGRVDEVISMMLMPRSAVDLIAEDSSTVTVTDKNGRVESIRVSEGSGGEETVDLAVKRTGKNVYAYEGKLSGKEVSGTFKSKHKAGLPGDELVEAQLRTDLFGKKARPLSFESYDPEMSLDAPIELTVTPKDPAQRTATITLGAVKIEGKVDAKGRLEQGDINLGPATLRMQRVAQEGDL